MLYCLSVPSAFPSPKTGGSNALERHVSQTPSSGAACFMIFLFTHANPCTHNMCTRKHTHKCTHTPAHTHTCMHTHVHAHANKRTHTHIIVIIVLYSVPISVGNCSKYSYISKTETPTVIEKMFGLSGCSNFSDHMLDVLFVSVSVIKTYNVYATLIL